MTAGWTTWVARITFRSSQATQAFFDISAQASALVQTSRFCMSELPCYSITAAAPYNYYKDRQQCCSLVRDARPGSTASGGEFTAQVLSLGLDGYAMTLVCQAFLLLVATRQPGACLLLFSMLCYARPTPWYCLRGSCSRTWWQSCRLVRRYSFSSCRSEHPCPTSCWKGLCTYPAPLGPADEYCVWLLQELQARCSRCRQRTEGRRASPAAQGPKRRCPLALD